MLTKKAAKKRLNDWQKGERAYKTAHHRYRLWLEQRLGSLPKIPASSLKVVIVDFDPETTGPYSLTSIDGIPLDGRGPEPGDRDDSKPTERKGSTPRPDVYSSLDTRQAGMAKTYARSILTGGPEDERLLLRSIEKLARLELRNGLRGLNGTTENGKQAEFTDLDDAVQDVLIDAWKALPSFTGNPNRFRAWIAQIIRHKRADIIKDYKSDADNDRLKVRLGDEVGLMAEREYEDGTADCVESPKVAERIARRGLRALSWELGYQMTAQTYSKRLSREDALNQIPGWVHGLDRAILEIVADGWEYIEIGQIFGLSEHAVSMRVKDVREGAIEDRLYDQTIYAEERRARRADLAGGQVTRAIDSFRQQRQLEMVTA